MVLALLKKLGAAFLDLVPIILVIAFFQLFILRQPLPNLGEVLVGAVLVVVGLMVFVEGLDMGLFPIGDAMATSLARKGSLPWLLVFGFGLGFTTTVAEPALIAVSGKAAEVATQAGLIPPLEFDEDPKAEYLRGDELEGLVRDVLERAGGIDANGWGL